MISIILSIYSDDERGACPSCVPSPPPSLPSFQNTPGARNREQTAAIPNVEAKQTNTVCGYVATVDAYIKLKALYDHVRSFH